MKFKAGLVIGFGAGYVLGARAGRERYEQLRQRWDQLSGSPAVHQGVEKAKEVAEESSKRTLHAVQQGVEKAGSAVKERLGKEGGAEDITESWPGPVEETGEVKAPPPPKASGGATPKP